jgi:DNA (cytosine-5)-methyltransferase 1
MQAGLIPTPKAQNAKSPAQRGQGGMDLQTFIQLLPTPAARDYKGANSPEHLARARGHHDQLPNAIAMLPTPTVNGNYNRQGLSEKSGDGLSTRITMLPTPTAQTEAGGPKGLDGGSGARKMLEQAGWSPGLQLQPAFVEWMMGYPEGWTEVSDSKPSATP